MKEMNMDLRRKNALITMTAAGTCWGFTSFFIKFCPWSAFQMLFVRGLMTAVFLTLYVYFIEKKQLVFNKRTFAVGIFVCFKYICFVSANKLTSAANAVAMYQSNVVVILIAGCIAAHALPRKKDIAVILAVGIGIALCFMGEFSFSGFKGNILAFISGICTAVMFFLMGRSKSREENLTIIIAGSALSSCMAFFVSFGQSYIVTPAAIGSILFLGLVQQSLAYIFYTKATLVLDAFSCAVISCIEPVISPIICFLLLGEEPGKFAGVGSLIIISSIVFWSITNVSKVK